MCQRGRATRCGMTLRGGPKGGALGIRRSKGKPARLSGLVQTGLTPRALGAADCRNVSTPHSHCTCGGEIDYLGDEATRTARIRLSDLPHMSRGHGPAQRFILRFLTDQQRGWWSAWELAEARWGRHPTRVEVQAIRNAMRRLEGVAEVELAELEPYWGAQGQLQDADEDWRPKRVFPTLVIGRSGQPRPVPLNQPEFDGDPDAGF